MSEVEKVMLQFLTFGLGTDTFAIDVSKAKEILDFAEVTKVPQMPDYMTGVLNLRSSVIPVINTRLKFGMPDTDTTKDSCIIVVEVDVDGESVTVGIMADSVQEVLSIAPEQIEPPPRIGTKLNTDFIKGMGTLGKKFVIILDIDKVFSVEELQLVQGVNDSIDESSETMGVGA